MSKYTWREEGEHHGLRMGVYSRLEKVSLFFLFILYFEILNGKCVFIKKNLVCGFDGLVIILLICITDGTIEFLYLIFFI